MFTNNYKMADKVIEVNSIYEKVHHYCREYLTDEPADFSVTIAQEDIAFEKRKSDSEYAFEGLPLPDFTEDMLEETAVYRKIAEKMPEYDTFVFHGSVIAVDGQGFLFTAKSGTGKSTHTRLWREYFGERAVMVNDDKPMLRITDRGVTAYGTPYNGKHGLGCNISVPLKAVCILTRGEKNSIVRIGKSEAYAMLLQQVYRPQDPLKMAKTIKLVDRLAENTELYRLACNMDIEAAQVAYNGMKG
ncbi:hypothetical protein [Ruminococcus flavefaciens]|uniref:SynChlorMet cassette protein ScmC n=1 Tax=Ruminococcus flavefaciens TaxID=1265 RepID=A0A1M7LSJ4_RUMFL|nr:hypothetical protein [Ruminococcus flavefaciens]SHM80679.1 hypothetical protein SAMN04487860_11511 [Ruminococcus flavefaciens]